MYRVFYLPVIVFFLSSCSSDTDKDQSLLSSLIAPNFSYKQDYFNCNLNKGNSLINIESFFSKIVDKYSEKSLEDLSLFLLFPDKDDIINSFTISIISQKNYESVLTLIEILKNQGIEDLASCSFAIHQKNGIKLINYSESNNDLFLQEILRCRFNEGYNYGTFKLSIDRFSNQIQSLKFPYSLSYVESKDNFDFLWINSFYEENYIETLSTRWIVLNDSDEIKDEFIANATCVDSSLYKAYKLI